MPKFIATHVPSDLDEFTTAYLECAEWTDMNSDNPDAERATGFDPSFIAESVKDCTDFQEAQADKLIRYTEATGRDMSSAGHDFWLTRNGHGTGFWDRGKDPVLRELTDAAECYGSAYAEFICDEPEDESDD